MFKNIAHITLTLALLAFFACSNDEFSSLDGSKEATVTFYPTLAEEAGTRTIGDATGIDSLTVAVYENGAKVFSIDEDWIIAKRDGVSLTLIEGRTYNILFWAENSTNTAYELTDDGNITVNYDGYKDGGFVKMEQMDAFCGTSSVTVGAQKEESKQIELSRPLAQFNFADKATPPVTGTHQAVVTFANLPAEYNPFTGEITSTTNATFTFTDFPTETLKIDNIDYYYLSSNYFFAPGAIKATLNFKNVDGTGIKQVELTDIALEKNKKTNVLGTIVQQPSAWSVWDGSTKTEPAVDAQKRYIIDEASDIAWLGENAQNLENNRTFMLTTDINMDAKSGLSPINLPTGSIIEGDEHTIKGVRLGGALFGDATNLTVNNLAVDDITISGATSHVGTLVNTLKGSSTFTNVTVKNASATTTNGAAGGFVGYIVRTSEKERNETLNVSFNGCKLNNVQVSASASAGKFVGLLSGYDNNESLSFDAGCEADATTTVADYVSTYTKANNSAWVTSDVTDKYNGWLGAETYRRAKVTFAGVRLAPKWDGETYTPVADLLLYGGASGKYEVQSPFDLAGVRNATNSPSALYLMENVDMYGQGADGKYNVPSVWTQSAYTSEDDNYFMSFSSIVYLDGNNKGIYNLNINTQKVSPTLYYGGFIQSTSGTTTHKNIQFHNSCVVVPLVVYKNEDKGSAGMLVSNIAGDSYTMDNVHTYGCKIFALQKVGGLAARVAATNATIKNISVNDGYIENYICTNNKENFSKTAASVTVSASFYSYGEIGGMFGFVEQNTTIDNAQVKGTTIYAYGQDDVTATLSGNKFLVAIAKTLGLYKVPGRHVGTFIGDVRTTASGGGTITMTNISVDSNTKCTNRWDKHNNKCETIGLVYYLNYSDDTGTVNYNGTKLTLMNCSTYQSSRNQ